MKLFIYHHFALVICVLIKKIFLWSIIIEIHFSLAHIYDKLISVTFELINNYFSCYERGLRPTYLSPIFFSHHHRPLLFIDEPLLDDKSLSVCIA